VAPEPAVPATAEPVEVPTTRIAAVTRAARSEPVEVPTSRIAAVGAHEPVDQPTSRLARVPEQLDPPTARISPVAPRPRIPAQAQRPAGKPRGPVRPPAPRPSEERVRVGEAG
jgi:hypothetical protein